MINPLNQLGVLHYVLTLCEVSHANLGFLGAFANFRKETVSFVMSVRPFVGLRRTSRLPLDGFSLNLILDFFKNMSRKLQFYYNLTRITGTLHEEQ
jgi:hypothetical protein